MQRLIELFGRMDDKELALAYTDYLAFRKTGAVPDGGVLEKIRDAYWDKYQASGVICMQTDLLFECATRWAEEQGVRREP